jgi:hypothetical protein
LYLALLSFHVESSSVDTHHYFDEVRTELQGAIGDFDFSVDAAASDGRLQAYDHRGNLAKEGGKDERTYHHQKGVPLLAVKIIRMRTTPKL